MENPYTKALLMVEESNYLVKGLKTMEGRDGLMINGNLYKGKKKVAELSDDGNGGMLHIEWMDRWLDNDRNEEGGFRKNPDFGQDDQEMAKFISTLPASTWGDYSDHRNDDHEWSHKADEYRWDHETVCNTLIDNFIALKEFKQSMKKITVVIGDQIFNYKRLAKDLDTKYNHKGKTMTFRDIILKTEDNPVILNDMVFDDAYKLFNKLA
jgi:hypothetical protein